MFTYTYNENEITNKREMLQDFKGQLGDYAAHAICHFVEHHNVAMLNEMQTFVLDMPKGKSASVQDTAVRGVALWIAKMKIHAKDKTSKLFHGSIENRLAKRELQRIFEEVGGDNPLDKLVAI